MSTFVELAQQNVENFLNSVVLIDDRAFSGKAEVKATKVAAPGRGKSQPASGEKESSGERADFHHIDTKEIVESFAHKGLICTVLDGESIDPTPVLIKADVAILDWQMTKTDGSQDDGERAKNFISTLADKDKGQRSRFICIYSGVEDLDKISTKIISDDRLNNFSVSDDSFTLLNDNITICILGKGGSSFAGAWGERAVLNTNLAERIIGEYTSVNSGLLQNAVLHALGAVRENTHVLLNRFPAELDIPFVSHRAFSKPIEDTKNHIVPLVTSEMEMILSQSDVNSNLSREKIADWINSTVSESINPAAVNIVDPVQALEIAKYYSCNGVEEKAPNDALGYIKQAHGAIANKKHKQAKFTEFLGSPEPILAEKKFAMLTCLTAEYQTNAPILKSGSIVLYRDSYYLCVMAACDCTRVEREGRRFIFLLLEHKDNELERSIFIKDGEEIKGLTINFKSYKSISPIFKPNNSAGEIVAQDGMKRKWYFVSQTHVPVNYYWIADLKPNHAQNIINAYASHFSRIGLTESEWLRLGKPKNLQ